MNSFFQAEWLALEQQRSQLIRQIGQLADDVYRRKPSDQTWSLAEVLAHLITVEKLSLTYMKKKALDWSRNDHSGLWSQVRLLVFVLSQRLPLKFKAPQVIQQNTPSAMPLQETLAAWDTVRNDMKDFLSSIPEEHLKKFIYRHPQVGRFNGRQALVVLREHFNHHLPQINSLLKNCS
jgi:uncharacterized damage-inducible protein DinB